MNELTNTRFPALPNYIGPTRGVFGLKHHDVLAEASEDIMERVRYYDEGNKPAYEMDIRRRCLVYLDPVGQPWEAAWVEVEAARAEWEAARVKVEATWAEVEAAWAKANAAWMQLTHAIRTEHQQAVEAQIRSLVPDVPWDGKALRFEKGTRSLGLPC